MSSIQGPGGSVPPLHARPRIEATPAVEQLEGEAQLVVPPSREVSQGRPSQLSLDAMPDSPAGDAAKSRTVGPVPLEGYDAGKLHNPEHRTPKYLFGRVASHYPLDQVKDHAAAEALLKQMLPDLKAAGLDVVAVNRDKIQVKTDLGYEWVDVVRGAGSGKPGWWWGSEGHGTPTPSASPAEAAKSAPAPSEPQAPSGPSAPLPPQEEGAGPWVPMLIEAAQWVKDNFPELFGEGDDRDKAHKIMTKVLDRLKSKGLNAHRVVNHPSRPVGDPYRYGSDALVVNGKIYDLYAGLGDKNRSTPQALYMGRYEAGRLKE